MSPYGQTVDIEHAADSITISSTQGVELTLALANGVVQSATTTDGRTVGYTYTDDRLSAVAAPGLSIGYRHNADGLIVEQACVSGTTTVAYDEAEGCRAEGGIR